MYNIVFEIILPGHSVSDDERALNDEQRDVGNEQDELDVVVAVNLGFGRIWRVTTESLGGVTYVVKWLRFSVTSDKITVRRSSARLSPVFHPCAPPRSARRLISTMQLSRSM